MYQLQPRYLPYHDTLVGRVMPRFFSNKFFLNDSHQCSYHNDLKIGLFVGYYWWGGYWSERGYIVPIYGHSLFSLEVLGYWPSHHKLLSHKTCGLGFWPCLTSVIYNLRGWATAPTLVSVTSKLEGYATGPLLRCYCRDAWQLSLDNYDLPLVLTVWSLHISIVLFTSCLYSAMYTSWEAFVFSTRVIDAITGLQCLSSVCRIKRDFHPQLTTKQNSTWTI